MTCAQFYCRKISFFFSFFSVLWLISFTRRPNEIFNFHYLHCVLLVVSVPRTHSVRCFAIWLMPHYRRQTDISADRHDVEEKGDGKRESNTVYWVLTAVKPFVYDAESQSIGIGCFRVEQLSSYATRIFSDKYIVEKAHSSTFHQKTTSNEHFLWIHIPCSTWKMRKTIVSAAQRNEIKPIERTHSTVSIVYGCLQTATYDSFMADEWLPIPLFSYTRLQHSVLFVIW